MVAALAVGVEGGTRNISHQVSYRARQHVLGIQALRQLNPGVKTALGNIPLAHGQVIVKRLNHGVTSRAVHASESGNLVAPVKLA